MSNPLSWGLDPSGYIKPVAVDAAGRAIVQGYENNVLFGYKDRQIYNYVNNNLVAGTTTYDWPAVPAQEMRVVTNVSYIYTGTITGVYVTFCIHNGADFFRFYKNHPATTAICYYSVVNIVMKAGDTLCVVISGATLNDNIIACAFGYSMAVP